MASQQKKAFCVLRFEVSRFVITVQREFSAWFKKDTHTRVMPFFKPCTKLTLHCHNIWTPQNGAHRKPSSAAMPFLKLIPQPHSKFGKLTADSTWETLDSSRCYKCMLCPCRMRNECLSTFEIAPFFCVYPICLFIYDYFMTVLWTVE
jgi:hypothetical protein